jgi:hypothetical protein
VHSLPGSRIFGERKMFSPPPDPAKQHAHGSSPTPPSGKEWLNKTCRWLALHPRLTLLLVVLAALGAWPLDPSHSALKPGATLVVPENHTSLFPVNSGTATLRETIAVPGPRRLTTWSTPAAAGFFAAAEGPRPFAFGHVPPENVSVHALKSPAPTSTQNPK